MITATSGTTGRLRSSAAADDQAEETAGAFAVPGGAFVALGEGLVWYVGA